MSLRVGFGYDVHRLVTGRPLILGGVTIPFEKGLDGHSDADVLVHAVMDALLGAAGQGDIGRRFPNTDPGYKGVSSLLLLDKVGQILSGAGFSVGNIDAVIAAEKPTLAGYLPSMEKKIAGILAISNKQVNVKATTTEGLGFTGTGEGIAAWAVTHLVESKDG
ncbi:MAG: 2-C-methyl-D-erythritol 2,4-cyclodiphosphate synthase [Eubacteriales bacterium]